MGTLQKIQEQIDQARAERDLIEQKLSTKEEQAYAAEIEAGKIKAALGGIQSAAAAGIDSPALTAQISELQAALKTKLQAHAKADQEQTPICLELEAADEKIKSLKNDLRHFKGTVVPALIADRIDDIHARLHSTIAELIGAIHARDSVPIKDVDTLKAVALSFRGRPTGTRLANEAHAKYLELMGEINQ